MENSNYPSIVEVADLIFQRVYEKNGKLLSLCWKNESCSFAFTDCFPDEIVFDKSCAVSYSGKLRTFAASFMLKTENPEFPDAAFPLSEFKNLLLDSIETVGARAQCDFSDFSIEELNIKIYVPEYLLKNVLEGCERAMDLSFWHEKSFSLTAKNDAFFISASFEPGILPSSSVFSLVSSYSEIFTLKSLFSAATTLSEKENRLLISGKKHLLNRLNRQKKLYGFDFTGAKNEN